MITRVFFILLAMGSAVLWITKPARIQEIENAAGYWSRSIVHAAPIELADVSLRSWVHWGIDSTAVFPLPISPPGISFRIPQAWPSSIVIEFASTVPHTLRVEGGPTLDIAAGMSSHHVELLNISQSRDLVLLTCADRSNVHAPPTLAECAIEITVTTRGATLRIGNHKRHLQEDGILLGYLHDSTAKFELFDAIDAAPIHRILENSSAKWVAVALIASRDGPSTLFPGEPAFESLREGETLAAILTSDTSRSRLFVRGERAHLKIARGSSLTLEGPSITRIAPVQ